MVVAFIQMVWTALIELLGGIPVDSPMPPIDTPLRLLLGFITIAGSAALGEEFLFRGVILSGLRSRSATAALLLTAVLFMLMHGSVETLPYTLLYGLLLGWMTLHSRSVGRRLHSI
jgi:membrane protease YdiL (CAAX protease family)